MSQIHQIKCGNVNCYIIENGTSGILVDTGKKEFIGKVIDTCKFYSVKNSLAFWLLLLKIYLFIYLFIHSFI